MWKDIEYIKQDIQINSGGVQALQIEMKETPA